MPKPSLSVVTASVCAIVLLGSLCPGVCAQGPDPTAPLYQTKIINPKGFDMPYSLGGWVVTGEKSSVVFKLDLLDSTGTFALKSYKLDYRGRPVSTAVTLLQGVYRFFVQPSISATWFDGSASGSPGYGLIAIAYPLSSAETKSLFAIATFDADGKLTSDFTTLKEIEAPGGQKIAMNSISLGKGEGKAGVAFCALFFEYSSAFIGYTSSKTYFAEISLGNGSSTPSSLAVNLKEIPLPLNGNLRQGVPFAPAWNGSRWLVPVRLSKFRVTTGSYSSNQSFFFGEDVMIAVVPGGNKKIRLRRLFGHNDESSMWSYTLYFFPGSSDENALGRPAGKSGDDLDLLYVFKDAVDSSNVVLYRFKYYFGVHKVNGKGKQVGSGVVVEIPHWDHGIEVSEDMTYASNLEFCSNPLVLDDGQGVISLSRTFWYVLAGSPAAATESRYVLELCLYSIDRETGEAKLMAVGNPQWDGMVMAPLLRWFKGRPSVLNSVTLQYQDKSQSYYQEFFSRF
jgi:hypothetical protein